MTKPMTIAGKTLRDWSHSNNPSKSHPIRPKIATTTTIPFDEYKISWHQVQADPNRQRIQTPFLARNCFISLLLPLNATRKQVSFIPVTAPTHSSPSTVSHLPFRTLMPKSSEGNI